MEEDILEKPYSAVLYRQSSIETVSNASLNSLDEKALPKIVDVKIKDASEIVGKSSEENSKDNAENQIHNSIKKEKKITTTSKKIDEIMNDNLKYQNVDDVRNSHKKKPPPPPPSRKKVRQSEDYEYKESSVRKLSIPNFLQDLESKLSKQYENPSNDPVYVEMKSPVSLATEKNLNIRASSYADNDASCSKIKIMTNNDNPRNPIYSEMKFVLNSETIPEETEMGNQIVLNKDLEEDEYLEKVCLRKENLRDMNKDEEFEDADKCFTPVALIKALKSKTQNDEKLELIEKSEENMATVRSKSPKPIISKNDKEESFWDKIGTLGRKKRIKEVQEVQEEGKYAIDSPGFAVTPYVPPEEYDLDENEERSIIMPKALEDPRLKELIQVLIDWINDELASQRIIVQDLTEDLYDGQVFQKLFEILTGHKLDVPEVTQSEEGQKQKLSVVLSHFNRVLGLPHIHNKWNVEVIHSKSIVPILHLLVALARHFRPPVRLPENVSVSVTVVQKSQGQLTHRVVREVITSEYSDVGMRCERDAFDTLFDHAPDKLQVVKKSMVTFVNKHLNKLNLEVTEIETQFHDGVYLIMLMGLLEGFFVPLYSFFPTPKDNDQKVHNVSFAFELMEEVGLTRPKARPEDVVNLDLKSTLRVLYNLFNKYKSLL